jgi:F0F1-type ATP synthase assembly protein I
MGYFRERARPALAGFLVGLVVGWCQPYMLGARPPAIEARLFITMQMGLAFTMIGLFLANYLEVRRRAIARYGHSGKDRTGSSAEISRQSS